MLSSYLEPARAGFLTFIGVGALILVPLVALHYWRFGRVEPRRAFVLYGLLAYGLVALALIFLPFPDPGTVCRGETMLSTRPFQWVTDMRNNMAANGRSGLQAMATSQAFVQQAFNVALFVPLGIVLRRAYRRGPLAVVAIGLGVSLAVEVVQYTGNLGIFPCPYRIADVDDLISNTAGSLVGWMVAPVALVVPAVPAAEDSAALPGAVGVPRRVAGLAVDLLAVVLVAKFLLPPDLVWPLAFTAVLRVVLPAVTSGWTPGGWLMRYRLRRADGSWANPLRLAGRELLGVTGLFAYAVFLSPRWDTWWQFGLDVLVIAVVLVGTFVVPVFRRDQLGWHDWIAGTRPMAVLRSPAPGPEDRASVGV
ncbi:VanZ family protein [Saccharothrix longispora]|uniref:Glycopeptide antibiotics resistance protein n=1 Tax=Saccharothrix longispora TaxID=33920 RepID=A0ABU1PYL1_9PSEU|nr:VanZ family protein [Saccharothrix longispora]MDR6595239.1 glycopeptide antibiotics resistance protein [Saccharothrix longispora]